MAGYLEFPVRYCSMNAVEERLFSHQEKLVRLKPEETAFVLVDTWDLSRIPGNMVPGYRSKYETAGRITDQKIKPTLEAAREVGLVAVYAPSAYVAIKYPQYRKLEQELNMPPPEPEPPAEWPPEEFRKVRWREFEEDRYWKGFIEKDEEGRRLTYISKILEPLEGECMVATSEQMNEILKRRWILNLIYVGFATNMCLIDKPGAMREMANRGYRIILLRDCTAAAENHNTAKEQLMTKVWIDWIEMVAMGYTATSEAFIQACREVLS